MSGSQSESPNSAVRQSARRRRSGSPDRGDVAADARALPAAQEAEDIQAIGVRLREFLVSFAAEVTSDDLVPEGEPSPKAADVLGWSTFSSPTWRPGRRKAVALLHELTREMRDYVNWLTHAKNARFEDAEFGVAGVRPSCARRRRAVGAVLSAAPTR